MKNSDMPVMTALEENNIATGLTKREHFAAIAMQGLLSNGGLMSELLIDAKSRGEFLGRLAFASAEYADALLAELEK